MADNCLRSDVNGGKIVPKRRTLPAANNGNQLDLDHAGRKPWPADAVMVVAAIAGTENRAKMQGVVECSCRDCGAALRADTYTVDFAQRLPSRNDRPVMFFCVECAVTYDRSSLNELHDHR